MQLDDLGSREDPCCLLGEAHHEDGAEREVRRVEARHSRFPRRSVDGLGVEAARPDHDRDSLGEAGADVLDDRVGAREVDRDVAAGRTLLASVDDLVPGLDQSRLERDADLPGRAVERDPHQAASSTSAALTRPTAAVNRPSSGPMPGDGEPLRREHGVGELGDVLRGDRLESLHDRLRLEQRRPRHGGLPEPASSARTSTPARAGCGP